MVSPGRRNIFKARGKRRAPKITLHGATRKGSFVLPKLRNGEVVGFNIIVRGSKRIRKLPTKAINKISSRKKNRTRKAVHQ